MDNVLLCPGMRISSSLEFMNHANLFLAGAGKTILAYVMDVLLTYNAVDLLSSIISNGHLSITPMLA